MARKKDSVTAHLLRAQMALRRERDDYLDELLARAIQHRTASIASGMPRSSVPQPDPRITKALVLLHERIGDRRLTIADLAGAAAMSPFHFARQFAKVIGCPPMAYVRHQRLQLARELLAHRPGLTVAAISLVCGLASQAHLSSLFQKQFGTSPAAFRKAAQQRR